MTRQTYIIQPEPHQARRRAMQAVADAQVGQKVTIADPVKSREQEEKYHAQIGDLSKQFILHGRKWDAEDMKRILIDGFKRETNRPAYPELQQAWASMGIVDLVPSLRGDGVVILGAQSRKLPKILASAFVEWLYALGAEVGIVWSEPRARVAV